MKNIFILVAVSLMAFSCTESARIDQEDTEDYIPEQVVPFSVDRISGGAIVKYLLPDDTRLRGVRAEYSRSGETIFTQSSKYVDSIRIEGLSDTLEHVVNLYSIGKNGRLSEPVPVTFRPGMPPIRKVSFGLTETFGGVRLVMTGNVDHAALALTILKDDNLEDFGKDPSDMQWDEVFTYYSSAEELSATRYGLDTLKRIYGVCARDRWLNYSDTTYVVLAPYHEEELVNSFWKLYYLPGDETECLEGKYALTRLYDGRWDGNNYAAGFTRGPRQRMVTIDMGYTASFSRMRLQPRANSHKLNHSFTCWRWQIWGSTNPNPNGSLDDSWYLLGDFTQVKPSGFAPDGSMGTITEEDAEHFQNNNDYQFDASDEILDPQRPCRYFRLVTLHSTSTFFGEYEEEPNDVYYIFGEILMWGTKK